MSINLNFCPHCGSKLPNKGEVFCPECGKKLALEQFEQSLQAPQSTQVQEVASSPGPSSQQVLPSADLGAQARQGFNSIVEHVNQMTGGTGKVELKLKDLVISVGNKHTAEEAEEIFSCGTAKTTPPETEISSAWPRPWLYSRVFLVLAVTFVGLLFMARHFHNVNAIPGIIFIGAMVVPFSAVIFFFEVNAPRNISIFEVTKIFFIGGVASLLTTCTLYEIADIKTWTISSAMMIGVVEELGKIMVVAYYLNSTRKKYILNGLLIGAAVGAGFAVFETAGYIMRSNDITSIIYLRGILALGGHVAWTGLAGAALAMVKNERPLDSEVILHPKFLQFLVVVIVMHGMWDMPVEISSTLPVMQIFLTAAVWLFLLVMINAGLRQISEIEHAR